MNVHETWAELDQVRRKIATIKHYLETSDNQDWIAVANERLTSFENQERDLLQLTNAGAER